MNSVPVVSPLPPGNTANAPVGDNAVQDAAESTPFIGLFLSLLANLESRVEAVNAGGVTGLSGPQPAAASPGDFPDPGQNPEQKEKSGDLSALNTHLIDQPAVPAALFQPLAVSETSARDAGTFGVLISPGRSCSPSLPLQGAEPPVQVLRPANAQSFQPSDPLQATVAGPVPQDAGYVPGLEEKIGQPLSRGGSPAVAEVPGTVKPLAGNRPSLPEIPGLTGADAGAGKAVVGIELPVAGSIPSPDLPVQAGEGRMAGDIKTAGSQPGEPRTGSPPAAAARGEKADLAQGQQVGLQWQPEKAAPRGGAAEPQAPEADNRLPLKVEGNDAGSGAVQVTLRESSPQAGTFSPQPEDARSEEVAAREIIKQVVDKAHLIVGRNVASLKLQLKPEFLGNLKLSISVEHGLVHARFTAENTAVANLIEARLPELQHTLAERGISWHQVSVSVDAQAHSGGFAHSQYEGRGSPQPNPYAFSGNSSGQAGPGEPMVASYPRDKGAVDYLV